MIDFRSDILGGVSPPVLQAMISAASDAPAFDLDEDRHQVGLESLVAKMFGFEAALFVPTGTMANQIAVRLFCSPGETIVADRRAHVVVNEMHSTAGLNGAALHLVDGERGHLNVDILRVALAKLPKSRADRHPKVVWLENTHNSAGGTAMPIGQIQAMNTLAKERGMVLHMDGARIWNAIVATGQDPAAAVAGVDTLTVNLAKALGAPIGALLLGNHATIDEAVRVRRMFGGWWRPVGMLAAAAIEAVAGFRERIQADHDRARRIAAILRCNSPLLNSVPVPDTNIVLLQFHEEALVDRVLAAMKDRGVLGYNYGHGRIRLVLHARIHDTDIDVAAESILEVLEAQHLQTRTPRVGK